jgi:hypothetical protein
MIRGEDALYPVALILHRFDSLHPRQPRAEPFTLGIDRREQHIGVV